MQNKQFTKQNTPPPLNISTIQYSSLSLHSFVLRKSESIECSFLAWPKLEPLKEKGDCRLFSIRYTAIWWASYSCVVVRLSRKSSQQKNSTTARPAVWGKHNILTCSERNTSYEAFKTIELLSVSFEKSFKTSKFYEICKGSTL